MPRELCGTEFDNLDACLGLASGAAYWLSLTRDETNSFAVNLVSCQSPSDPPLTTAELLDLLPAGSTWVQALGWRSIVGIPFQIDSMSWLALGIQRIHPHPLRGAYPVFGGYLHQFPSPLTGGNRRVADGLRELAQRLDPTREPRECSRHTYGIVPTHSSSPDEHMGFEASMLRRASVAYAQGRRLLFRTLILSADELKRPGYPGRKPLFSRDPATRPPIHYTSYLMATVPSIRETFSWSTKLWMLTNQSL